MSSSAQIVSRALRRLRVIGSGESPSADDAADGLAALNAMIASWEGKGVKVSGDVPLDARFEQGVVAMLAVRLAPDYGKSPDAQTVSDASEGWSALCAAFKRVPLAQFDTALRNVPSKRYWYGVTNPQMWAQKTPYSVGDQMQANGHVFECTASGISGTLIPQGTGTIISDGSVTWKFVRDI